MKRKGGQEEKSKSCRRSEGIGLLGEAPGKRKSIYFSSFDEGTIDNVVVNSLRTQSAASSICFVKPMHLSAKSSRCCSTSLAYIEHPWILATHRILVESS